jgi:hypothetical protein
MNDKQVRTSRLQQIPVFKLREQVFTLMKIEGMDAKMQERIEQVMKHPIQNPAKTVERMKRGQLISLINACDEISDDAIFTLFEAYRYGANPSFHIYLVDTDGTESPNRLTMQGTFFEELRQFNRNLPKGDPPRVKHLVSESLNDLEPGLIEGDYSFHKRYDYIDTSENPTSTYETVYGFFWIHLIKGYVIIHATDTDILHALENAIIKSIGTGIYNLIITRQLKNALPFILNRSVRSCRFHDPDPASKRFRWVTIADDDLYNKGYQEWEDKYPEINTARYLINIGDQKPRSLNIGFENGTMSLTGKLDATQFRDWARKRLEEIIVTLTSFKKNPASFFKTHGFNSMPQLAKYSVVQKNHITNLVADLLELRSPRSIGYANTEISPLVLARDLGDLVAVQLRLKCEAPGCDAAEDYLGCEHCENSTLFHVTEYGGQWYLECIHHRSKRWAALIPIKGQCEKLHDFQVTVRNLERKLEILPTRELLTVIGEAINTYTNNNDFDSQSESFIIRGRRLLYFKNKDMSVEKRRQHVVNNYFNSNVEIGTAHPGAVVKGIEFQTVAGGSSQPPPSVLESTGVFPHPQLPAKKTAKPRKTVLDKS